MSLNRFRIPAISATLLLLSMALPPALAQDTSAGGSEPAADPAAARADLSPANQLVRTGAYEEAERTLTQLQEEFPDDPALLLMRGEILLALKRPADALPLLERCVELDPERERVHFQLATARQITGDREAALAAYARECELNDDPKVQVMALLNRSLLLEQSRDPDGAAAELERVLELEPGRLEVYGDLASLYIRAGRLDDASGKLDAGREAGFRSARHLYSLGAGYFKKKSYQSASVAFSRALEIDPGHAESVRSLAITLDELGREQEAVQQLRRYLELKPDAPDAQKYAERIRAASGS